MTLDEMEAIHKRNKELKPPKANCCDVLPMPTRIENYNDDLPQIVVAVNEHGEAEYQVITEDGRRVPIDEWDDSSWRD